MNSALVLILSANALTFLVSAAATFRRPILSYFLITSLAFAASVCALRQVVSHGSSILSSVLSILLLATIIWRALLNAYDRTNIRKK